MDDCQASFKKAQTLPPNPKFLSLTLTNNESGAIQVDLLWEPGEANMDDTDPPTVGTFLLEIDGEARGIQFVDWDATNTLDFNAIGNPALTSVRVTQQVRDPKVLNLNGILANAPQTITVLVP